MTDTNKARARLTIAFGLSILLLSLFMTFAHGMSRVPTPPPKPAGKVKVCWNITAPKAYTDGSAFDVGKNFGQYEAEIDGKQLYAVLPLAIPQYCLSRDPGSPPVCLRLRVKDKAGVASDWSSKVCKQR